MTLERANRLTNLMLNPTAPRGRGPCGYHCMRLGWTAWMRDGGIIVGEYVTESGQRALARCRGQIGAEG